MSSWASSFLAGEVSSRSVVWHVFSCLFTVLQSLRVSGQQSKQALSQLEAATGKEVNVTFKPASPRACLQASGIGQAAYFISNGPQELMVHGACQSGTASERGKTLFLRCWGSHCGGRPHHGTPCWREAKGHFNRKPRVGRKSALCARWSGGWLLPGGCSKAEGEPEARKLGPPPLGEEAAQKPRPSGRCFKIRTGASFPRSLSAGSREAEVGTSPVRARFPVPHSLVALLAASSEGLQS